MVNRIEDLLLIVLVDHRMSKDFLFIESVIFAWSHPFSSCLRGLYQLVWIVNWLPLVPVWFRVTIFIVVVRSKLIDVVPPFHLCFGHISCKAGSRHHWCTGNDLSVESWLMIASFFITSIIALGLILLLMFVVLRLNKRETSWLIKRLL
jgi:hypothetical protein